MTALQRRRNVAWLVILVADAGFLAWGAMAALAPEHLPGPGLTPIVTAGYEGFTGHSWSQLTHTLPPTAAYITLLFRLYGAFNVAFGLLATAVTAFAFRRGDHWAWWVLLTANTVAFGSAMAYDRIVNAIGPFEMLEYVGIAAIFGALAATWPRLETADRAP